MYTFVAHHCQSQYPVTALVGVVEFTKVGEEVGGTNHYVLKEREKTMKRVQKLKNEMTPAVREKIKAAYKREVANKKKKEDEAAFEASTTSKKAKSYAKKGKRGYKD
tara:strand:- start:112 stop:432 length:321 start_codon:yes stop_codon:yes gene_type:complete